MHGTHLQGGGCTLKLELPTKANDELFEWITLMSNDKSVILQVL